MAEFRGFMSNEPRIKELVLENKLWQKADSEDRNNKIKQLVAKTKREKIEKSDPFYIMNMVSTLKNNVFTPADFEKRKR